MNNRGQITIFIIIGIIILASVGLYLAIRSETIKEELSPEIELTIEEVPIEFRPVSHFIEGCIQQIAEEGLTKLGERGGFIDLVDNEIITTDVPTLSDAVQFSPGSEYSVPYWWHLDSPNECSGNCQFTSIPENKLFLKKRNNRVSIESQMEDYIKENLYVCIDNFRILESQGFEIEEKGDISPTVTIAANDIIFFLNYPVQAKKAGIEDLENFFIRVPLNMNRIYQVAKDLTEMEGVHHFLERDVLNLIVGFSGVDKDRLPPMADTKVRIGNAVTWKKTEVGKNIENMLASNIQLLQVYGTNNYIPYSFPGNSLLESLYNRGMLVPGSEDWSDLEVRFNYLPWWEIYFDMNCDGDTCKPESLVSDLVALMGIQQYNFIYDLSFPVEVEITDPTIVTNESYKFRFFLEANIRQNEPMATDFNPIEGIFEETTMLCEENKRTSGDITINAKDFVNNHAVDGVQVIYSSLQENCMIGTVENGTFKGKFPVMLGGTVGFLKENYLTYSRRFDTELNKRDRIDVNLKPILTKSFVVKKKLKEKVNDVWKFTGKEVELTSDENASIRLTRKPSPNEGEFSSAALYQGTQTEPSDIQIAPGTYDINVDLTYNKDIVVPPRFIEADGQRHYLNGTTLEKGFRIGGTSINHTFSKEELQKDLITFYVINPDIVSIPESQRVLEDITEISDIDSQAQRYKGRLRPGFE